MAARKAGRYFTVGETTYAPGETVPAEVVALVDNDAVWKSDDEDAEDPASESDDAPAKRPRK